MNTVWLGMVSALIVACGSPAPSHGGEPDGGGSNIAVDSGAGGDNGTLDAGSSTTAPQNVAGLVALANSLPRPAPIAAFIAALPHPLALNATSSQFSLQPAPDATTHGSSSSSASSSCRSFQPVRT